MPSNSPLFLSQHLLSALGTQTFTYYEDRIPEDGAVLVVSNHRSFMDVPVLIATLNRPVRFACHHYMGQVPVLSDVVTRLGCFPLAEPNQRQRSFFHQAAQLLRTRQTVGIFPEGAQPMVNRTQPYEMRSFQRGFAHLALRAPIKSLAVLPVAIASTDETVNSVFPLRLLRLFDPSEPLFDQPGWHPMVVYNRVNILVGQPLWITDAQRSNYGGKQAKSMVAGLTDYCSQQIKSLLETGR
ncbi:MAG: lysophospholipid acyltransferase family protein [Elainellaceae cyanobacterium]